MAQQYTPESSRSCPITVAGCGDMGAPMLAALHKAGYNANGFDIADVDPALQPLMLKDAVDIRQSHIVMVVVRDEQQIDNLLFEQQCVYADGTGPHMLIVSSTVSPAVIERLRDRLTQIRIVDAPMSGAPHAAEQATLSYMLGGDDADIHYLMPVFETLGRDITHVGPLGAGMMAKVLNNYVAACSVVAVRRVLSRAQAAQLDIETLKKILAASSGANWYGDNLEHISWARQSYDRNNTIGIIEKDVKCALAAAETEADNFDNALLEALRNLPEFPRDL